MTNRLALALIMIFIQVQKVGCIEQSPILSGKDKVREMKTLFIEHYKGKKGNVSIFDFNRIDFLYAPVEIDTQFCKGTVVAPSLIWHNPDAEGNKILCIITGIGGIDFIHKDGVKRFCFGVEFAKSANAHLVIADPYGYHLVGLSESTVSRKNINKEDIEALEFVLEIGSQYDRCKDFKVDVIDNILDVASQKLVNGSLESMIMYGESYGGYLTANTYRYSPYSKLITRVVLVSPFLPTRLCDADLTGKNILIIHSNQDPIINVSNYLFASILLKRVLSPGHQVVLDYVQMIQREVKELTTNNAKVVALNFGKSGHSWTINLVENNVSIINDLYRTLNLIP